MRRISFFLSLPIAFILMAQSSLAYTAKDGNVTVTLGPYVQKTILQNSPEISAPYLGGGALVVQGDIDDKGSLEIGMFHGNKLFYREVGDTYLAEVTKLMLITMGYRRWITEYFSAALAFYSSYPMGDAQLYSKRVTPGVSIDTSASDITEYGFDVSLQGDLWIRGKAGIVFDLRYQKSVTSKRNEQSDQYGALIGIRYLIQERTRSAK